MPQTFLSSWLRKPEATPEPPVLVDKADIPTATTSKPSNSTKSATIHTQRTNHAPDDSQTAPQASATPTIPSASPLPFQTAVQPPSTPSTFLTSLTPTLPPLPAPISLTPMTPDSIPAFRRLNALLLPIPYPQSFYDEILADPVSNAITLLAFWDPSHTASSPAHPLLQDNPPAGATLVAALRCRVYPHPSETPSVEEDTDADVTEPPMLYISTLVLLPSYRGYGIATHLLAHVLGRAIRAYGVAAVTAHVWEANDEGRAWYKARGFAEVGVAKEYYRKLRPSSAVLVRRAVGVGEYAAATGKG